MSIKTIGDYGVNTEQKKALTKIFLTAMDGANHKRNKILTSNYNFAIDIKDYFLTEDLKEFCEENGFEFVRQGLSLLMKTPKAIIKVKCHNSLDKTKKQKKSQIDNGQLFFDLGVEIQPKILELELGYETTLNREELNSLQMVDFENVAADTLYMRSDIATVNLKDDIEQNASKSKANNIRPKTNKNNVIRLENKR